MPHTDNSKKLKILVTGASGQIGTILRSRIGSEYQFIWVTHKEHEFSDIVSDLSVPTNKDKLMNALRESDIVLHLAADADPDAPWDRARDDNIQTHYNILDMSKEAGVRRFIFASSNHAMTGAFMYDKNKPESLKKPTRRITEDEPYAPDSLYGVTKVFGENIGKFYSNRHGMENISIRIGWVREKQDNPFKEVKDRPDYAQQYMKAMHLSQKDMTEIMKRCFEFEFPKSQEVKYECFNACSNNDERLFDLTHLKEVLGYTPEDNAAKYFPK